MARHGGIVAYLSNRRAHIAVENVNADGQLRGVKEIRISLYDVASKSRRKRLPFGIVASSLALEFTVSAEAVARAGYRVGDDVVVVVTPISMFDEVDPTTEPTMDPQPKRGPPERVCLPPKKMFKVLRDADSRLSSPPLDEAKGDGESREINDKLVLTDGDYAREIGTRSSAMRAEDDIVATPDQDTVRRMSKEVCKWWLKRLGAADVGAVYTSSRKGMQAALLARLGIALPQ